ncbi:uncharacterized protein METZ01_LOCUS147858, partial [marine metagenome]
VSLEPSGDRSAAPMTRFPVTFTAS